MPVSYRHRFSRGLGGQGGDPIHKSLASHHFMVAMYDSAWLPSKSGHHPCILLHISTDKDATMPIATNGHQAYHSQVCF